jgi:hypothetical protein
MIADHHPSQYLGPGADIDMPAELRAAGDLSPGTDRHLLKEQTVWPDFRIGMDHDTVGMRQEKPAGDPAVEGDIGSGDDTPETVPQHMPRTGDPSQRPSSWLMTLVPPNVP